MDIEGVNLNGRANAHGHLLGATGAVLMTKLVHVMNTRKKQFGIATLCVGSGQGVPVLLHNKENTLFKISK
ncbi:hypothetical protein J7E63_26860 [Bacillus sp. ISL-75]|nr:hypothetical protein [Bacillus sp. ISL-75]